MLQSKKLIKGLIPSVCGSIGALFFYIKAESIDGADVLFSAERKESQFYGTIGDTFLVISMIIGAIIIAKHVYSYAVKPTVNYAAPKIKETIKEVSKEKNLSKATKKLRNYKELRDAGVLTETEYQKRVQELKTTF